eukprot:349801-Chlamydomonas_euryale.AAC.69
MKLTQRLQGRCIQCLQEDSNNSSERPEGDSKPWCVWRSRGGCWEPGIAFCVDKFPCAESGCTVAILMHIHGAQSLWLLEHVSLPVNVCVAPSACVWRQVRCPAHGRAANERAGEGMTGSAGLGEAPATGADRVCWGGSAGLGEAPATPAERGGGDSAGLGKAPATGADRRGQCRLGRGGSDGSWSGEQCRLERGPSNGS